MVKNGILLENNIPNHDRKHNPRNLNATKFPWTIVFVSSLDANVYTSLLLISSNIWFVQWLSSVQYIVSVSVSVCHHCKQSFSSFLQLFNISCTIHSPIQFTITWMNFEPRFFYKMKNVFSFLWFTLTIFRCAAKNRQPGKWC